MNTEETRQINPGRRKYQIQIDESTHEVEGPNINGQQILALANKDAELHFVTQVIVGDDDIVIGLDDKVNVSEPRKKRFTTVAKPKGPCNIIVNTRKALWNERTISFDEVVKLAYPDRSQDDPNTTVYTVKFRCGDPANPEGSLVAGRQVKIRCGEVFDVDRTCRS